MREPLKPEQASASWWTRAGGAQTGTGADGKVRSPWCLIQAGRREEELGFACGVAIQGTSGGEILSLGERHDEAEQEDSSGLVRGTGAAAAEGVEGHHVWGSLLTKPTNTNMFGELLLQEQDGSSLSAPTYPSHNLPRKVLGKFRWTKSDCALL